jgi:hypothetical protein
VPLQAFVEESYHLPRRFISIQRLVFPPQIEGKNSTASIHLAALVKPKWSVFTFVGESILPM